MGSTGNLASRWTAGAFANAPNAGSRIDRHGRCSSISGGRDEALDLGLADALITSLSNLKYLTVRATSSVKDFVGSTDPVAAGQALRVGAVVTGTVQKVDGRVRVNVRLISVSDGKAIWAGS